MSTPNDSQTLNLPAQVGASVSWFKQHETLLIVLMVLAVLTFGVYKYFDLASAIENHKAQQAQAILQTQTQKTDTDLAQAKQLLGVYQTTVAQALAANNTLAATIASRDKQVVVQVTKDAQLPPSQLATRWQGLVKDSGVVSQANGYAVTDSAGLATVEQLEQAPALQADLTDERTKEVNLQKDVDSANALIAAGKTAMVGLQNQLTDQQKADTATLNAEKAAARKGKLKWFGIGFASGFVAGVTVHIW
jgi:hypothetical protein